MFARQHGERSSSWKQPELGKTRVQGVRGDRQVGAGEDSPRPTRDPRGWEAWGPCCPVPGTGCVLLRVGWNSGLRARGQMGSTAILGQSSCYLSSSLPSSLPRKIPARKLGVCGGLSAHRGCGSLPATPLPPPTPLPIPPPCKGQLVRLSWQGWPGARAGETASGARPWGHTASHSLQQRRKENSERLRDPEIINVGAGRSLPCRRPAPCSRQGVGPGREGD